MVSSDHVKFFPHTTITNSDFRFIVCDQLQAIGIDPGHILIELEAKNTAPAILAASIFLAKQDPEAILLVAPSDHIIPNILEFHKSIQLGLDQVKRGKLVTFGISPTRPETGYGYLEVQSDQIDRARASSVIRFIEKPSCPV